MLSRFDVGRHLVHLLLICRLVHESKLCWFQAKWLVINLDNLSESPQELLRQLGHELLLRIEIERLIFIIVADRVEFSWHGPLIFILIHLLFYLQEPLLEHLQARFDILLVLVDALFVDVFVDELLLLLFHVLFKLFDRVVKVDDLL